MKPVISASTMCADLGNMRTEIEKLDAAGVDRFHWDIMDGSFVPNMTFGPDVIKAVRSATKKEFALHLMVEAPERNLALWEQCADMVVFHVESTRYVHRLAQELQKSEIKVGCALNPLTPPDSLQYLLPYLSQVLVMTVEPGFAGQKMIPETALKVRQIRKMIASAGYDVEICVDGNINVETGTILAQAGANAFVAGTSSVFKSRDYDQNVREMQAWLLQAGTEEGRKYA